MFKIAVYLVTTLALAQQSNGLSKCYEGAVQMNDQSRLRETACSTDCVKMTISADGEIQREEMSCDGNNSEGALRCASQKDKCAKVDLPGNPGPGIEKTRCCCSSDLCNVAGSSGPERSNSPRSGLSGALALAFVAAIFWGQN